MSVTAAGSEVVTASTSGTRDSGNLTVTAREIDIAGEGSGVFAQSNLESPAAGRAGNVTLAPPEGERLSVRVRDGAVISVESKATRIFATNSGMLLVTFS